MTRRILLLGAGFGLGFVMSASGALAQFGGPPQQQQGFETTGQNPANYTPEESAAADVVVKWINTTNTKDLAAHMALIDDKIAYRADPAEALGREGPRGYCTFYGFVNSNAWVRLDELYVIGGPDGTLALVKRIDINGPATGAGLGGYPVQLADLVRVKDGKIVEWYDIPINKIGPLVNSPPNSRPQGFEVPDNCMAYPGDVSTPPPGGFTLPDMPPPQPHPVAATKLGNGMVSYGSSKQEGWFNVEETAAARTIRGWFAARKAGDPKLLAGFVDKNAIFRADVDGDVVNGRDALLKTACAVMGSGTLELNNIYLIGADFETTVIAGWDRTDADGTVSKMGSFFRVQNGLITEWMDTAVDGTMPKADPNSAACQTISATLANYRPLPIVGGQGAAAAPAGGPPGAPPAGAPPAGGPPAGGPPA